MLNKDICEKCLKVTMSQLPWFDCDENSSCRARFWDNGYVHCYHLQNISQWSNNCEYEMVKTELWAGDPLPKLPEGTKWSSVIEGRKVSLPPPEWCPYILEHTVAE